MMVVVKLTGCFGLRAGEAVALKREDIVLHGGVPKIRVSGETAGARKSPGEIYIRLQDLDFVKQLLAKGITGKHIRGHKHGTRSRGSRRRTIEKQETYRAPKSGYLFTAKKNAARKHLSYHAVYLAVRQEAPKFFEHLRKQGRFVPEVAKLRPHSGRAQLITELMGDGLSTAMSMKYARHAVGSVKVHLKYGRLTLEDVKRACDETARSTPPAPKRKRWASMSVKELRQCQDEIRDEIKKRASKC